MTNEVDMTKRANKKGMRRMWFVAMFAMLAGISVLLNPGIRKRLHVVALKATGHYDEIAWGDLLEFMQPSSGLSVNRMIEKQNAHAVIRNPRTTRSDVDKGQGMFVEQCAVCHGGDASGTGATPSLVDSEWKHGVSDWALFKTIRHGVPDTPMPAHDFEGTEVWQLISYIRSLERGAPFGEEVESTSNAFGGANVSAAELDSLRHPGDDWLTYSGSYRSNRNSTLKQIDTDNIANLSIKWVHQFTGKYGRVEVSPLVRDGAMFVTLPTNRLLAIDARSGDLLWKYEHKGKADTGGGQGAGAHRGPAMLRDKIFIATSDRKLTALNSKTGKIVWQQNVMDEDSETYSISGAPIAYGKLIVTGITARRVGRGFITAFDAETGKKVWKFDSVPGPGQFGHDTWAGDSWERGGGSTWITGSYDAEEDVLYWGVGNPKPDYIKSARVGNNLFTNSVIALRGSTGELLWHFQFTPGDDHDWDSAQIPVLADVVVGGDFENEADRSNRKYLLWANRNGFYYVLDRENGKFVAGQPYVRQNWAKGLDENGHPILVEHGPNARDGVLTYPSNKGGTNWWSPSYDPELGLFFVPYLDTGMVFFPGMKTNSAPAQAGLIATGVRALDALTGERVWDFAHKPRTFDNTTGGLLSTQGGLVFGSDMGKFFALNTKTGKELWSVNLAEKIEGTPVTYVQDGKQYVAIAGGGDLFVFGLPD